MAIVFLISWLRLECLRLAARIASGPAGRLRPAAPSGRENSCHQATPCCGCLKQPTLGGIIRRGGLFATLAALAVMACASGAQAQTPAGTVIANTAYATFNRPGQTGVVAASNTVRDVVEKITTQSSIVFMAYAPALLNAQLLEVNTTQGRSSGNIGDPFEPLDPPIPFGRGTPLDLDDPVPLVDVDVYHSGEPVFLLVTDADQNIDPVRLDTILVTLTVENTGEKELVVVTETGPDTGIFAGYIQSRTGANAVQYDGWLNVVDSSEIVATYVDQSDGADVSVAAAMVDPMGIVFDSVTGLPVDGATVTLIDDSTGAAAAVFGDDGVSAFPAAVTSGGSATDSSGAAYTFSAGGFRFPFILPGDYRLEVKPPHGYTAPSTAATADLQALPNAPFDILEPGSRGEVFSVVLGPVIRLDYPVDPVKGALWVTKEASKEVAAIGDFLQYRVTVENSTSAAMADILLEDRLPLGFRYQSGSLRVDGKKKRNPEISKDGRTLTAHVGLLGAGSSVVVTYVTEVSSGAPLGEATNRAQAFELAAAPGGKRLGASNLARATVLVRDDLMGDRSFIIGRIVADNCANEKQEENDGVAGVRIFLEDGQYAVTDAKGMYHFEGVKPGVHVVQMDADSLPGQYQAAQCEQDTRHAGRAFSQFVDIAPGAMWRADFFVETKPAPTGRVKAGLDAQLDGDALTITLNLEGETVPVKNVRATVMMPQGAQYQAGTCTINGKPFEEAQINGPVAVFRLGDTQKDWTKAITFQVKVDKPNEGESLTSKAVVMFDSPTAGSQRMPVLEHVIAAGKTASEGSGEKARTEMETTGLKPGTELDEEAGESSEASMDDYGEGWLENAGPGHEWVYPSEDYCPPIPAMKLAIKHHPSEKVAITLNGEPISGLCFEGMVRTKDRTKALSKYTSLHLKEGFNIFTVACMDSNEKEVWRMERKVHYSGPPVNAKVLDEQPLAIADGKTPAIIQVLLTDKDGFPARDGVIGEFYVESPYAPYTKKKAVETDSLSPEKPGVGRFVVTRNGVAHLKIHPTSQAGEVVFRLKLHENEVTERAWIEPAAREWILVGLAEGSAGYRMAEGHRENLEDTDLKDMWWKDGRTAFFAKGQIKGKWLLTLSYDSARDDKDPDNRLFKELDPDAYYTLYGDASDQGQEAASREKLYVKVERDRFYAVYGDYDTDLTVTDLSRYSRTLTGFKSKYEGKHLAYDVFVSETNQAFVKDEIRGDGSSGLYKLSRSAIAPNSEKVTIETRHRFRSQDIVSSEPMARTVDYIIDYDDGTLFFKQPVSSRDDDFNPVFIVVDYEAEDASDKDFTYGGRVAVKLLDDKVEVGGTHVHEGGQNVSNDLLGADLTVDITESTEFKAEYAHTDNETMDQKTQGEAYLAQVTHQSKKVDGRVYFRDEGGGFGLGQQNAGEGGKQKYGGELQYHITDNLDAEAEAYRNLDTGTRAQEDMGEAGLEYTRDRFKLRSGVRFGVEELSTGETNRVTQVLGGGSVNFLKKRLELRADHEQTIGKENANTEYPTRSIFGVDFKVIDPVTLFAEEELTWGDNQETEITRGGVRTTPWTGARLDTSVEKQTASGQDATLGNLSVGQSLKLTERWSLDAAVDHSRTLSKPGNPVVGANGLPAHGADSDFVATSLGAAYEQKDWKLASKVEFRFADDADKWNASVGWYGEADEGLGLSVAAQVLRNDYNVDGNEDAKGDLRFGAAWRPKYSRWTVLDRLDLVWEDNNQDAGAYESRKIVNNINANYKAGGKMQFSFKHGAKYVMDHFEGDHYSAFTDLLGLEMRFDIARRWDVGFRSAMRHSWNTDQYDYSAGPSIGFNPFDNAWLSLGYNLVGFRDEDFEDASFLTQGPYVQFRLKFDQFTKKDLEKLFGF